MTSVVGKFRVEVSGYLHILLWTQIRNYIYYRGKDKERNKDGAKYIKNDRFKTENSQNENRDWTG